MLKQQSSIARRRPLRSSGSSSLLDSIGSARTVVREHYFRDDIPCESVMCVRPSFSSLFSILFLFFFFALFVIEVVRADVLNTIVGFCEAHQRPLIT